jgi:hypothetical protein
MLSIGFSGCAGYQEQCAGAKTQQAADTSETEHSRTLRQISRESQINTHNEPTRCGLDGLEKERKDGNYMGTTK